MIAAIVAGGGNDARFFLGCRFAFFFLVDSLGVLTLDFEGGALFSKSLEILGTVEDAEGGLGMMLVASLRP